MNLIPLQVAKTVEQRRSWDGIATPYDLAIFLATLLSVDLNQLSSTLEIVYSDVEPSGDDAKKIWIKQNAPVGIGIPVTDGYQMIYQIPQNIPFLRFGKEETIPSYLRKLTEQEMTRCGLDDTNETDAFWVIFTT